MNNQPDLGQFATESSKVICCLLAERVMLFPKTKDVQEIFHGPGQKETVVELDRELLECTEWNSSGFLK